MAAMYFLRRPVKIAMLRAKMVPGLRNLGNTCYAAAVLQALASCPSLLQQLEVATRSLPGLQPPQTSFTAVLLNCLQRLQPVALDEPTSDSPADVLHALRQCIGESMLPAGQEHDAVEAYEVMLGLVADELQKAFISTAKLHLEFQGSLSALLQPASDMGCPEATFKLGRTGHAGCDPCLTSREGHTSGMQREGSSRGGSSDTDSDGQLWCVGQEARGPSLHPATWERECQCARPAEENGPTVSGLDCSNQEEVCRLEVHQLPNLQRPQQQQCHGKAWDRASSGEGSGSQLAHSCKASSPGGSGHLQQAIKDSQSVHAYLPVADPVLQSWRAMARLLCQGSLASELQCLRCRHHFASQVTPFLALPLSIPLAPGRNAFGHARAAHRASLEGCLQQYLGYEALQGVTCTRCSLQASLEAAEADRLNHKLVSLREALWRDALFIESDTYQQAVQGAGLEWVGRSGPVAKRHVLARLPTMLCLQLRRVFWGPAGEVKVSGHVSFPLALRTDALGLPTLGHAPHAGDASAGYADLEPSNSKAAAHGMPDGLVVSSRPAYLSLRAVVLHYGGPSSGGHYVVYRCLDAAQQQWARVSDEEVRPGVSRQEVLQAEATMLLYEERGQASVSLVSD